MKKPLILAGVHRPWLVIFIGLLLIAGFAAGIPKLFKDTRADAFLSEDNPVLVYKDKVKAIFGLSDPMVIAVESLSDSGIYTVPTLQLIAQLTERVNAIANVNESRTMSLATDKNIVGTADGMLVTPFYDLLTTGGPTAVKKAIKNFPLYNGKLVSADNQMSLIVVELVDNDKAEATYSEVMDIIAAIAKPEHVKAYVAGEGAVLGYLSHYIDRDAKRLNPLAALIITIMLVVAFRRWLPALLGNVVILSTIVVTIGAMAHSGVPFYVITNAMPVILIGISVADSIHIFSHYYECQAKNPNMSVQQCIEEAVTVMWRPVTLTTLTTMAGFFGLYASAYMPPFKYFGLFSTLGVLIAWFFSIFVLPALIVLLKPKVSKQWIKLEQHSGSDTFANIMVFIGRIATAKPLLTVTIFALLSLMGLKLSAELVVNENRINTFHQDEAIYIADKAINAHVEGTNAIDIVIETRDKEDIFDPRVLRKMDALQTYAKSLDHVNGSISVVDYLKQMNKSLNEGKASFYTLPDNKNQIAQYFLIYAASSDPTDFDDVVDYDYRIANIRLHLDTSEFVQIKPIVEALEIYVKAHFSDGLASANLSGRVTVNYHWIKDLGRSHVVSVVIAMLCVLLVSALLFRSLVAGLLAITPVLASILVVYAAMVVMNVDLGIGTSMFASVAIGLGVDFAIHTIDRLKALLKDEVVDLRELILQLYPTTGRALLFNYLAIAFGFGVLISSKVVPLTNFGTIVVLSVTISFITSMALIPALVLLFKPRYFFPHRYAYPSKEGEIQDNRKKLAALVVIPSLVMLGYSKVGHAAVKIDAHGTLDAFTVMEKVDRVNEGQYFSGDIHMVMINEQGKERTRKATSQRRYFGEEKRTIIMYSEPANVAGTGFLTYDYPEANKDDDQWLYLPALRRVRRISSSERGDFFLGTDFTYEDIKKAGKVELADYNFSRLADETIEVNQQVLATIKIEAIPKTSDLEKSLGFSKSHLWISPDNWALVQATYWDQKERLIRTYTASDIRSVDGILTKHKLEVKNHKTGHYSRFEFSNIDYKSEIDEAQFSQRAMTKK